MTNRVRGKLFTYPPGIRRAGFEVGVLAAKGTDMAVEDQIYLVRFDLRRGSLGQHFGGHYTGGWRYRKTT